MSAKRVQTTQATLALNSKAILGEGALWHPQEKKLYWVDIEGRSLNIFDPKYKENYSIDVEERIGTVVPCEQGGVLVALQHGIFHLDVVTGKRSLFLNSLNEEGIRYNDGKCDPVGRFWVGTMALDKQEGAAKLYRIDLDGSVSQMLENLTISNGIVWNRESNRLYFTDTPTQQVWAFDYDEESGGISNKQVIIEIPEEDGAPDGMTLDADGNLWVALHGAGAVGQYNPASGELLQKVKVPAPNTTSCAFGGENLDELYITTARDGMNEEQLNIYPESGGIFSVKLEVKGLPANFYKGSL